MVATSRLLSQEIGLASGGSSHLNGEPEKASDICKSSFVVVDGDKLTFKNVDFESPNSRRNSPCQ
jgi:hypothetical protein